MPYNKLYFLLLVFFTFLIPKPSNAQSGGVKGYIYSSDGEPLPFATVYVRNTGEGGTSNQDGYFEISLPKGENQLYFQFMGYQTQAKEVKITDRWLDLGTIVLDEQTIELKELKISSRREDPALTIMRKAIAKSKANLLQVDAYKARVYMRGTGQLDKAPFFMKKELKKEGIAVNEAYTSESVSEIEFEQPNRLKEKVISVRTSGSDNATSPNSYITSSIYNPTVVTIVSPLAPNAFTYYRFQYEGSFIDKGVEVNKIKVTPRSKGDKVFTGYIFIIENLWQVHSLDLESSIMGVSVRVNQMYEPIEKAVWMPISHTYDIKGSFMGFGGSYKYIATVDYKDLKVNPAFQTASVKLVDEKVEEVKPEVKQAPKARNIREIEQKLQSGKEVSRKEYRQMINAYEKEQREELDAGDIMAERTYMVDSGAYKKDSAYWSSVRSIPLTSKELKGYQRDDSLFQMRKVDAVDTANKDFRAKRKFKPQDLIFGGYYPVKGNANLNLSSLIQNANFNTVEGLNLAMGMTYFKRSSKKVNGQTDFSRYWSLEPLVKYNFAPNELLAVAKYRNYYRNTETNRVRSIVMEAGRWNRQFNNSEPIHPFVNTLATLFFQQNWMKLYQEDFAKVELTMRSTPKLRMRFSTLLSNRRLLENNSDFTLWRLTDNEYTSNMPEAYSISSDDMFQANSSAILEASFNYQPFLKFRKYNSRLIPIEGSSPEFNFLLRQGVPGLSAFSSTFTQIEAGFTHQINLGISLKWDVQAVAGTFLGSQNQFFADYKHFDGNRTILGSIRPTASYRLLDYYQYSTNSQYLSVFSHFKFRRLLLTNLPTLRQMGVKENIFVNYLKTQESPHYLETGYTLDNLFRILRVEIAAGLENGQLLPVRPRIGIATFIGIN